MKRHLVEITKADGSIRVATAVEHQVERINITPDYPHIHVTNARTATFDPPLRVDDGDTVTIRWNP